MKEYTFLIDVIERLLKFEGNEIFITENENNIKLTGINFNNSNVTLEHYKFVEDKTND